MLLLVHTIDSAFTTGEYEVTRSSSSAVKNNDVIMRSWYIVQWDRMDRWVWRGYGNLMDSRTCPTWYSGIVGQTGEIWWGQVEQGIPPPVLHVHGIVG